MCTCCKIMKRKHVGESDDFPLTHFYIVNYFQFCCFSFSFLTATNSHFLPGRSLSFLGVLSENMTSVRLIKAQRDGDEEMKRSAFSDKNCVLSHTVAVSSWHGLIYWEFVRTQGLRSLPVISISTLKHIPEPPSPQLCPWEPVHTSADLCAFYFVPGLSKVFFHKCLQLIKEIQR